MPSDAFALIGIASTVAFGVAALIPAPRGVIIGLAVAFVVVLIITLFVSGVIADRRSLWHENRERRQHREAQGVEPVPRELSIDEVEDGSYGFEEMFSIDGLQHGGALLKRNQRGKKGQRYTLEVHQIDGDRVLVGYVAKGELPTCLSNAGRVALYMRKSKEQPFLVDISVSRIGPNRSLEEYLDLHLDSGPEAGTETHGS